MSKTLERLFGSRVRVRVLGLFLGQPGVRLYPREISRRLGEHYSAVWRELENLEAIGLLESEREGQHRYHRLNPDFPLNPELKRIVLKTIGLGDYLRDALEDLGEIRMSYIYGSFAAGEEDAASDVDLMVVGDVDLGALSEILSMAEQKLGRSINSTTYGPEEYERRLSESDPFLLEVESGPKIVLVGPDGEVSGT